MNKVVIVVKGGVVTEVYGAEEMEVEIIDLDNEDQMTDKEIESLIDSKVQIY